MSVTKATRQAAEDRARGRSRRIHEGETSGWGRWSPLGSKLLTFSARLSRSRFPLASAAAGVTVGIRVARRTRMRRQRREVRFSLRGPGGGRYAETEVVAGAQPA